MERVIAFLRVRRKRYRQRRDPQIARLAAAFHSIFYVEGGLSRADRRIVLFGQTRLEDIALYAPILEGFRLAGFEPTILMRNKVERARQAYSDVGVREIYDFESLFPSPDEQRANKIVDELSAARDLLNYSLDGIDVGRYALSGMMRRQRIGRVNLRDPRHRELLGRSLVQTVREAEACRRFVGEVEPEACLILERAYPPHGALFDACVQQGGSGFISNGAQRADLMILKRYENLRQSESPRSLDPDSWSILRELDWSEEHEDRLQTELAGAYESGDWYPQVGTQFHASITDIEAIRRELRLDPRKQSVGLFPHIFYDGSFFWGQDLFDDYQQWFEESAKAAIENDRCDWIIKIHPANIVQQRRSFKPIGGYPELEVLKRLGPLPGHVKVLTPETSISTYALIQAIDICLTVRGTVGMEAAAMGKLVLTAGTGAYDQRGFTVDSSSSAEYLQRLRDLPGPDPTPQGKDLAGRYAYGVFIARPLRLTSVDAKVRRDALASLVVDFKVSSRSEMETSSDVQEIARWVESGTADYLDPDALSVASDPRGVLG